MPPTIRLIEAACAAHRLDAARAFIESHPSDREILIVGASRGAADDLARLVAIDRGATFGLHRFSLIELSARLALTHMAGQGTAPTTSLGSEAMATRVSFQALDDGALNYYSPVVRFPGFPRALARTLAELRLAGIAPHTLETAADGDVSDLLWRFAEQLQSGQLHDLAGLLNAATEAASADPTPALLTMPVVLLDVPVNSPAHHAFVAALLAHAPSGLATLPSGDEETRRAFQALAPASVAATPPASADDELDRLRTFIFSAESPPEDARTGRAREHQQLALSDALVLPFCLHEIGISLKLKAAVDLFSCQAERASRSKIVQFEELTQEPLEMQAPLIMSELREGST